MLHLFIGVPFKAISNNSNSSSNCSPTKYMYQSENATVNWKYAEKLHSKSYSQPV